MDNQSTLRALTRGRSDDEFMSMLLFVSEHLTTVCLNILLKYASTPLSVNLLMTVQLLKVSLTLTRHLFFHDTNS